MDREIIIANKHGMCSGVQNALSMVEDVLKNSKESIYIYHEIVHNNFVINSLKKRGVIFVNDLEEVPENSTLIFSAHGVAKSVEEKAKEKHLKVIDATCPLVKKNHQIIEKCNKSNQNIIFLGQAKHSEVEAAINRIEGKYYLIQNLLEIDKLTQIDGEIALLSQTTLSQIFVQEAYAKLQKKYPNLINYGGICYATTKRQNAMRELCQNNIEAIIVVGSNKSSNSKQLCAIANNCGKDAYLVESVEDLPKDIKNYKKIGVSSGASTPIEEFNLIVDYLQN